MDDEGLCDLLALVETKAALLQAVDSNAIASGLAQSMSANGSELAGPAAIFHVRL